MPPTTPSNFDRLIEKLRAMGPEAQARVTDTEEYRAFAREFPLNDLPKLTVEEYCLGTGRERSFSWWVERGLEPVMGRYMPGTARGHIVYWDSQRGALYKNRALADLRDAEAVAYTAKVQYAIATCPDAELASLDDDGFIYRRAGVEPRVTVGKGRKLRLLACYRPEDMVLIASADHVIHFLRVLGLPESEIPEKKKAVAGMLALREFYLRAKEAIPGLTTRGFMRGLYDQDLNIAPPPRKEDWDSDNENDDAPAPAYLLTWNPENASIGGDGAVQIGEERRWTCHSTQPRLGDTVWLVRLGQEPKGIVMRGVVTGTSEEGPHWKDSTKTTRYIRFRVEEWRPDPAAGLVPLVLLNGALPKQRWSPQISGLGISEPSATQLRQLWETGRDTHSLCQFVQWETRTRASVHLPWLKRYRETANLGSRLRANPNTLDSQALRLLWSTKDNGVANVGAGALSETDFKANESLLIELTRMVLARPDAETFRAVVARWKAAVGSETMSKVNWAVIRRLFAAVHPESFTTILPPTACQRLLVILRDQFQLEPPPAAEADWPALNASITSCMRLAGLVPQSTLENNIAMWQLVKDRASEEPQDDTSTREPTAPYTAAPDGPLSVMEPRNIVLYGPPGTGKTWSTVKEAMAIVAPELLEGAPEEEVLKAHFDEFVDSGQIVFTTFHQSYSYEDFVEGLRATSQRGTLEYSVEPGVFKRLCDRAGQGRTEAEDPFDKALLSLRAKIDEAPNRRLSMKTSRGKPFDAAYDGGDTFRVFPASSDVGPSGYTASMRQVRELYVRGEDQGMYNTSYVRGMLDYLMQECALPAAALTAAKGGPPKPFVLVIDEINRGNVSRIFGELITLIEVSKRAGMSDQLTVTLPYSKEPFTVPANVHIIATMNTADRSLTGLDIALRRRFEFIEMPPRPDRLDDVVVGELSVGRLLRVMNQRIELLLDRDHCLGHAMFLPLERDRSLQRLKKIFRQRVLPLLQEYFFDDWQRIQWVLNDHRKPEPLQFVCRSRADVSRLLGDGVQVNEQRLWAVNEKAFDTLDAYVAIIDAKGEIAP